jgi:prevent-host-death family protein
MDSVTVGDARKNLAELLNRVAYGKERVIVTRHGKEVAAIVPMEELGVIDRLRSVLRSRAVKAALEDVEVRGGVAWDSLKDDLDL